MIRSHVGQQFNSEQFNSEQFNTVPKEGLEPSHPKAQEPKSCVSTSSTTPAQVLLPRSLRLLGADRAWNPPTSSSFADEKACRLAPPQHGEARSGVRLSRFAWRGDRVYRWRSCLSLST